MTRQSLTSTGPDRCWYQDAVIYALHVKTFHDGNGDGVGDFEGLTGKLDYLTALGVSCVWLLPFYESPLRDDGYDIADYERIHPMYGTLADFDRFVAEAHARGIRVITELVLNHTSDRHPWFQAARRAPKGSSERDFYVWSDTADQYAAARVIFHDAESSNWSWHDEAGAYYWHRFFHHQPDLNFDNPEVREAIARVVRFWLDRGVDGLRLDAVPHLFEREGTTCDNLPETHAFLKALRADVDCRYANRVLLAEANQPPAEVRPYFGDGDECHMAFHFPLMPRLFLALARQDASPIVEIVRETADIPPGCQWAVYLRNHDELTLSAVDEDERPFMLDAYAPDPPMRLNRGIRRRLAPLLGNDRAAIDLAFRLLLSLPGSPVIYYGDEIGMGDNVLLNDRDGLRTPMQWNDDRQGGFSRGNLPDVVPPPVSDPMYTYQVVNVDRQQNDVDSLLSGVRRLIRTRRQHPAFGRGTIEFLDTANARVIAFIRRCDDEAVVIVANLSASAEPVTVQLPECAIGLNVFEMLDGVPFPFAGEAAYPLTISARGCYWLELIAVGADIARNAITGSAGTAV